MIPIVQHLDSQIQKPVYPSSYAMCRKKIFLPSAIALCAAVKDPFRPSNVAGETAIVAKSTDHPPRISSSFFFFFFFLHSLGDQDKQTTLFNARSSEDMQQPRALSLQKRELRKAHECVIQRRLQAIELNR